MVRDGGGRKRGGGGMQLGIALEGGGARCAAQAGVLAALLEAGIRPACYAGCGAGALVAALAATDALTEEAVRDFERAVTKNAFLRNHRLNAKLRARFESQAIRGLMPLAMPAVDLESGAVQVIASMLPVHPDPRPWSRQALLSTAVRAAMATPGALPPVSWRGRTLSGGGMLRGTLPTILRAMGAERIVCIRVLDAGCAFHEETPAALAICAHAVIAAPPPLCDMMIAVTGYAPDKGVLDKRTVGPLFEAGRAAARKAMPALVALTGMKSGKILPFPRTEEIP